MIGIDIEGTHVGVLIAYSALILLLVAWPVLVTLFLLKYHERLANDDFKKKYNAFYQGIKVTSF